MELTSKVTDSETAESRWHWLYKVGGAAALIVLVLFLIGIIGIITTINGWFTPFQNNWLLVLFKLNAGFSGVQGDSLSYLISWTLLSWLFFA